MISIKEICVGMVKFHLPPSCGKSVWFFLGFIILQLLLGLGELIMGIFDKDWLAVWIGIFWFVICIVLCCLTAIPAFGYIFGWLLLIPYIYFILLLIVACIFFFSGKHPFESSTSYTPYTYSATPATNYGGHNTTVESVHIDT